jgi:hypothetical protein
MLTTLLFYLHAASAVCVLPRSGALQKECCQPGSSNVSTTAVAQQQQGRSSRDAVAGAQQAAARALNKMSGK